MTGMNVVKAWSVVVKLEEGVTLKDEGWHKVVDVLRDDEVEDALRLAVVDEIMGRLPAELSDALRVEVR